MSAKLFEQFLAERFLQWIAQDIQPGQRYQFRSPDPDNAEQLYRAFLHAAAGQTIQVDGQALPYVVCSQVKLLPVLHGDRAPAYTENYISRLRDEVAGRIGAFADAALLIIHNSMLDTLINSARDLAEPGAIWNPKRFENELGALVNRSGSTKDLMRCLLDDQLALIVEEGATVFGFAPLFSSLCSSEPQFEDLGLFNDPLVKQMSGQVNQIRRRLSENRALRREIEFKAEHFSDQLEDQLKTFSPKFVKEHFTGDSWRNLDYQTLLDEEAKNAKQKLAFETVDVANCVLHQRAKSQTKSGQKSLSLLIEVPANQPEVTLDLRFSGLDLQKDEVVISLNKAMKSRAQIDVRTSRRGRLAEVKVPFDGAPTYFRVETKRENQSERYQFNCLLVEQGSFYLEPMKNVFRVDPGHKQLTLLLEENKLALAPAGGSVKVLDDASEPVDCQNYAEVNFERLINETAEASFEIQSGEYTLILNIEGPVTEEGVKLPLLFDQGRLIKLFQDDYFGEFHRARNKIIIDNSETAVVGVRQQLINAEAKVVDERLLYVDEFGQLNLAGLADVSPDLHAAYLAWFDYMESRTTLPSLVSWGPEYQAIVQRIVDAFENALNAIPTNAVLSQSNKQLLHIGMFTMENVKRIAPWHPLVMSYHLHLVTAIQEDLDEDKNSSFANLPEVTLDRLVASGLLPFVYDAEAGYGHVVPLAENTFWLDVEPQKNATHSYVRRLVKDKLAEFTKAYAKLFTAGPQSTLIINAINQADAEELFLGLADYFVQNRDEANSIQVNFYDEKLAHNAFDRFAESATYDELKVWLGLNRAAVRAEADMLIDLIRSHLTYSKFVTPQEGESLAYAHLAFFRNNARVEVHPVSIEQAHSGVLCDGLIAGEAAENKNGAYFTAFGLNGVEYQHIQPLRLARLVGMLYQPTRQSNLQYLGHGIGLAVSTEFKSLLTRSYDSALWTTIIDPKVTLDFFTAHQDVVLIHYSDQYTSSASYDAITVTKQVSLFKNLLGRENLMAEFNAFNGEWLLKMLTTNNKQRKEKNGIIGAYKFVTAMLRRSDIAWVPLSVAEIIRVSGNVGLKMTDSEFSRNVQGYRKGAISDDVLFVGFKGDNLYLLPLEVKTGVRPDYEYAGEQARELKRYLAEEVLGGKSLAAKLYRGLFIRQVLMQLEKFRLYGILDDDTIAPLLSRRGWWLKGDYNLATVADYPHGFVVAHVEDDTCFVPKYELHKDILRVELPYALLDSLIDANSPASMDQVVKTCLVPENYLLHATHMMPVAPEPVAPDVIQAEPVVEQPRAEAEAIVVQAPAAFNSEPLKVLFGHDALLGTPMYWEPTNTAKFMNTNSGIIGTMGTGKTQFTKSVITQLMCNQANNVDGQPIGMLIFDYKSDYVDNEFISATKANKYNLYHLPYNPLSLFGNTPMLPVHTAAGFAETMSRAFQLGKKQQNKLQTLILECYEAAGISPRDPSTWENTAPTIGDLWRRFNAQEKVEEDSLYAALSSLATFEIFETDSSKLMSLYELINGVTVIELASYPPQIQNLVVALTLDLFYSQMQRRGKPQVSGDYRQITKVLLVDEADNFMSQDFTALRKILKEGREYGVGMVLSTQDITHFKTNDNDYSAYILTWVVHRVSQIKNSDIKAIFNKDDKSEQESLMREIRELEKHHSLYVDGSKKVRKMKDLAFWELELARSI